MSDLPVDALPPVDDAPSRCGSAQFHQTWMFIRRRRRRLAADALRLWRSQCGWLPSPWTSIFSPATMPSSQGSIAVNAPRSTTTPMAPMKPSTSVPSGTPRTSATTGTAALSLSWVDLTGEAYQPLAASRKRHSTDPNRREVKVCWKRTSGASVEWEEDVFAPPKMPENGRVEWDENEFGPASYFVGFGRSAVIL